MPDPPAFRDVALANAFPNGLTHSLATGSHGSQVVAVQYALGRLDYLRSLPDGSFGAKTAAAVRALQQPSALPVTGTVDAATLAQLDERLRTFEPYPPAAHAADPLAYLGDFDARGLTRIAINDRSRAINWAHPEVVSAY